MNQEFCKCPKCGSSILITPKQLERGLRAEHQLLECSLCDNQKPVNYTQVREFMDRKASKEVKA